MYWTGHEGGPDGENFSFYLEWVSIEDRFVKENEGFLIVIKPASRAVKVWVTPETMRSMAEQHEAFRVHVKALRAELRLERQPLQVDWDGAPLTGPKEDYVELLKRTTS